MYHYPHTFLKKNDGDIASASIGLSVHPSRYLHLNHWTKSNQIWCGSCSHVWGAQGHIFFLHLLARLGGKFHPGIYRWHLPVFPGIENKAQVGNTGKYNFCCEILENMIFSCKMQQISSRVVNLGTTTELC